MRSRLITAVVAVACLAGTPRDARALEETVPRFDSIAPRRYRLKGLLYPRAFLTVRRKRSSRRADENRKSFPMISPNFVLE